MAGVVLDAGTGAHLQHHLDIEGGARLEPLRLQQLPGPPEYGQPLGQLGADSFTARSMVARSVTKCLAGYTAQRSSWRDGLAGERVRPW